MSLLYTVPDAHGILIVRLTLLVLSIAAVVVGAITLSTYDSRVASTGALTPSGHYPLVVNAVSLIPSAISIVWSITHLSLLARRLLQTHHRNQAGLTTPGKEREAFAADRSTAVVHPGWVLATDTACWVFFLVVSVLTGIQAANWKSGQVYYGSEGTRQVDLTACPTFDQTTSGVLDYWCEQAWGEVVDLTTSSTSILGTLTYVSL